MKKVSIREATASFSRLASGDTPVLVENRGRPVAVIVPLNDNVRGKYPELLKQIEIVRILAEAQQSNISPDELAAIIRKKLKKENGGI